MNLCDGCALARKHCPVWTPGLIQRYCVVFVPASEAWREAAIIHHKAMALSHGIEARRLDVEEG